GGAGESGRTRGFQLWIALPPELEGGPSESVYLGPERIPNDGPARVLRNRDKCDPSPVTDELPRRAFEGWRTLELPAAHRAHGALGRRRNRRRSRSGGAAAGRSDGLQSVERCDRIRGPVRCGVCTGLGCPA